MDLVIVYLLLVGPMFLGIWALPFLDPNPGHDAAVAFNAVRRRERAGD